MAMLAAIRNALVDTIYPPRCLACTASTEAPHGLCATCWRDTHFISGSTCATCGVPLMGAVEGDRCESCTRHPPAWDRGAAAVIYSGAARRAILSLKHGDRLDLVAPLAEWMAASGRRLLGEADLIVPVPLHWRRLVKRRYNQSAELARRLAAIGGVSAAPDLLQRVRATVPQDGMDRAARTANQADAFRLNPRRAAQAAGARVLLVDDVMTSGATLSACAETLRAGGAEGVDVLVLARVAFADKLGL